MTKFRRFKQDPTLVQQKQVAPEHLTDLDHRLQILMSSSDERSRLIDFEQIRWQTQQIIVQLEDLQKLLNRKQGDLRQTEDLIVLFQVLRTRKTKRFFFLLQNRTKFFVTFFSEKTSSRKIVEQRRKSSARIDASRSELRSAAEKRFFDSNDFFLENDRNQTFFFQDDRTSKELTAFCEQLRKNLKSFATEFKSKEHLLQETLDKWNIYEQNSQQLEKWFNDGRRLLMRPVDEQLVSTSH